MSAPTVFALTPTSAYAAVCGCAGQACECNSKCCGGYTEFCCTITGENACPPGGILGGWWKVDGSSFCGGSARYYMDCHLPCGDCACGDSGVCSGACNGTDCECANRDCGNRKAGCSHFRYGNCNNDVACLGPILCRVVTCTAPWVVDDGCSTVPRTDNNTRYHDAPCLHDGANRPRGYLEAVTASVGSVEVRGWAFDVDHDDPVRLHVYVDGRFAGSGSTTEFRADVRNAFDLGSARVGFRFDVPVTEGRHEVCVYAIDDNRAGNPTLGCRSVEVTNRDPRGFIDSIEVTAAGARVRGWAFDPDVDGPVTVHVYGNRRFAGGAVADLPRRDVQRAFGLVSDRHGFDVTVPVDGGRTDLCVYVINRPTGSNPRIGCGVADATDRDPFGWIDSVVRDGGDLIVSGWAHDPDAAGVVDILVYVDGSLAGVGTTGLPRPDVQRARLTGPASGFRIRVPAAPSARTVTVVAVDIGPGSDQTLGVVDL